MNPLPFRGGRAAASRGALAALAALAGVALMAGSPAVPACSACGCMLNADWASQGINDRPGWSLDLRGDDSRQDDLRTGTRHADAAALPLPAAVELQRHTANRIALLTLDDGLDGDLGLTVQLPWISRDHATVAAGDTAASTARFDAPGDVRVLGRFLGLSAEQDWGVQAGLKLPTGATNRRFDGGPQAGTPLDRGLQPGTGSTDLLLGLFHFGMLGEARTSATQAFGSLTLQWPLAHAAGFRPGTAVSLAAGLREAGEGSLAPQLQLAARFEGRETGALADTPNSGSTRVELSPGLAWSATPRTSLYAFAQIPLYQRVNGLQLEPRWSASAGLHLAF